MFLFYLTFNFLKSGFIFVHPKELQYFTKYIFTSMTNLYSTLQIVLATLGPKCWCVVHFFYASQQLAQNGQRMKIKQRLLKGEQMPDVEEEDEEEDEEEIEGGDVVEEDDDDEEEEEDLLNIAEEEEEEEEQEEEEEEEGDDKELEEKTEFDKKRKKAKRQKKERSKRKEREEDEEENEEQKKKRVVVVRLDLLKGHSEVGRSDLSAP